MNDTDTETRALTAQDVFDYLAAGDVKRRLTIGQAALYARCHGDALRRWLVNGAKPYSYARGER